MKKLFLIMLLMISSLVSFSQNNKAVATQKAVITSNLIPVWDSCNIEITIIGEKEIKTIVFGSNESKTLNLISFDKVEFYNDIETVWYDAEDNDGKKCKVMIQFLYYNYMSIGIMYKDVSYKYIAEIKNPS